MMTKQQQQQKTSRLNKYNAITTTIKKQQHFCVLKYYCAWIDWIGYACVCVSLCLCAYDSLKMQKCNFIIANDGSSLVDGLMQFNWTILLYVFRFFSPHFLISHIPVSFFLKLDKIFKEHLSNTISKYANVQEQINWVIEMNFS